MKGRSDSLYQVLEDRNWLYLRLTEHVVSDVLRRTDFTCGSPDRFRGSFNQRFNKPVATIGLSKDRS